MKCNKYIVILGIYRPHSNSILNFNDRLNIILNHPIVVRASLVLLAGDMNINICNPVISEPFMSLMYSNNYIPTITKPTRIQTRNDSQITSVACLDHIWLGKIDTFMSGILLYDISDHLPTLLHFSHNFKTPDKKIRSETRPYSEGNLNSMLYDLFMTDWNFLLVDSENEFDPNVSCVNFLNHVNKLYCKNFPRKIKFISQKRQKSPWFTSELKRLVNKKSWTLKQLRAGRIPEEVNCSVRNEVNQAVRTAKITYYQSVFQQSNNNMKKIGIL